MPILASDNRYAMVLRNSERSMGSPIVNISTLYQNLYHLKINATMYLSSNYPMGRRVQKVPVYGQIFLCTYRFAASYHHFNLLNFRTYINFCSFISV